jgi:hypothetical protein
MYVSVAVDHLVCVRSSLIESRDGDQVTTLLHTYAQFSLIRAALSYDAVVMTE